MAQKPTPESLYQQLGSLLASAPDLTAYDNKYRLPVETMTWIGRVSALIRLADPHSLDVTKIDIAGENLVRTLSPGEQARQIMLYLHRALAKLELQLPAAAQGAFIPAGSEFDALAAIGKILGEATSSVLIVDPYMDERALTDFAVLMPEQVNLLLLTDEATHKAGLVPAAERWIRQYDKARPLTVKVAPAKSLHDRIIIVDAAKAWILTQSLKDFAKRSHAMIQRSDPELTKMKVDAFDALCRASKTVAETP
jgi:hypothetical protein